MAKKELSHTEIWDDSALVDSWNEALEEYKKYHSLAAEGEQIEVALDKVENGELEDVNDHEVIEEEHDEDQPEQRQVNGDVEKSNAKLPSTAALDASNMSNETPIAAADLGVPRALLNNDQDLKNLMMSWYYAGYYTGLYEGQQKAHAEMQVR